jgi:hypothetical protein
VLALDDGKGTSCSSGPWFLARFVSVRFTANLDDGDRTGDLDGDLVQLGDGDARAGPRRRDLDGTLGMPPEPPCRDLPQSAAVLP